MPIISVIVPVYKVEPYLRRCVDSILAQKFTDFELILVDDGSPDNCGVICDEYAAKDSRVRVIHQENGGLSAARNTGIDWVFAHSDSEWISFVDSDDWVHPQMLEWMLHAAHEHGAGVITCRYKTVSEYEAPDKYSECLWKSMDPESFYIQHMGNCIVAYGKLYEKEKWRSIRFPVGRLHEDGYVTHILMFSEKTVPVIDMPLYMYYNNPKGITHTPSSRRLKDACDGQRERLEFFRKNGFSRAYDYEINSTGFLATEISAMRKGIVHEDKVYCKDVVKRLRKAIRREHISFKKHIWVYECAYPNLMKMYWLIVALGRKLGLKG